MTFKPEEHFIQMGNKDYLEVKWRLVWFREDHPKGQIATDLINIDPPIVRATVTDATGILLGTGHGSAFDKNGNAVWKGRGVEKAETAAIGRALGVAGYGTQFAGDELDDADHLADSPVEQRQPQQQQTSKLPFFAMGDVHRGISDLYPTDNHRAAVVEKGQREGWLINGKSTAEWVKAIRDRHESKTAHWTADKVQAADFLEWAKAYYDTTKAIGAALQASVQYPVAKLADWKGTVPEAQAAVLAAHCEYDRARIDAVTNAMRDLPEGERSELAFLARQVVERAKFNGVQPEKVQA